MPDIFSKKKRSEIMSRIRGKDTKPEIALRKLISAEFYPKGYRYRKHYSKLPGKPDIVFVKQKIAIFMDGEFWHGYKFKMRSHKLPKKYWLAKIQANMRRDRRNNRALKLAGWRTLRFWEREIKNKPQKIISKIREEFSKKTKRDRY